MKPENHQKVEELMSRFRVSQWQLERVEEMKDFKLVFDIGDCQKIYTENIRIGDKSRFGKVANNAFKSYKKALEEDLKEIRNELAKL